MRETRKKRLQQVLAWLEDHFPAKRQVRIRFEPKIALLPEDLDTISNQRVIERGDAGECIFEGRNRAVIRIGQKANPRIGDVIETLLHEWAHVLVGRVGHGDSFWKQYGKIYRAYFEQGGAEASKHY